MNGENNQNFNNMNNFNQPNVQNNLNQGNVPNNQNVPNQNNVPNNKPEKKSYCGLLLVFMAISLLLAGYIVCDKCFNKDEPKEPEKQDVPVEKNNVVKKIDESKPWYYMEEIASYEIFNDGETTKKITYEYPVINIDSSDAKKINENLKKQSVDAEKAFINQGYPTAVACSEISEEDIPSLPYIIVDGTKKYLAYYDPYKYRIKETEDYVTIVSEETINVSCDWWPHVDVYVVSKTTGKELSQKEIAEAYGYNYEEILQKYNTMLIKKEDDPEDYNNNHEGFISRYSGEYLKSIEDFVKEWDIKLVKISDELELYSVPYNIDEEYHYYFDGNEFKAIE